MSSLQEVVASKRAVIFDLYHTLTALEITSARNAPYISDLLGVDWDDWSRQLVAFSHDRWTGKLSDGMNIVRSMAHAIDPAIPEERVQTVLETIRGRFRAAMREMPEESLTVLKTLKERGKMVALLSNADVVEAAYWPECRAADLFDVTIFSCEVSLAKPDRAIYHHCLEQLKVEPAEAVFVGDGNCDELVGAKQVGLTTVMMAGLIKQFYPERLEARRAAADFEIERLIELV